MVKEYGGKEAYASKAAMRKHEKSETKSEERKEKKMKGKKSGLGNRAVPSKGGNTTMAKIKSGGKGNRFPK